MKVKHCVEQPPKPIEWGCAKIERKKNRFTRVYWGTNFLSTTAVEFFHDENCSPELRAAHLDRATDKPLTQCFKETADDDTE